LAVKRRQVRRQVPKSARAPHHLQVGFCRRDVNR
jgi:hypothetical protein